MEARVINTGEIIDIVSEFNPDDTSGLLYSSDSRAYRAWELDFVNIKHIDWEQRRYEIAKAAIQGILSNENEVEYACLEANYGEGKHIIPRAIAQFAIACADALIEELKK